MARIKYDVSNVEETAFEQPKPGLYPFKFEAMDHGESKAGNPQLTCQLRITRGEYKGALLWHYVPTDPEAPGAFRMVELLKCLGINRKSGSLDTDKVIGTEGMVRVKADSYQGEYRARVGAIMAVDADDEDLDDDEDGGDDEPEEKVTRTRSRRRRAEPEPEPDDDDDDDDEPEPEPAKAKGDDGDADDDEDDYDEWSVEELRNELKERQLRHAGKKESLIARLRADDESEDDPFS